MSGSDDSDTKNPWLCIGGPADGQWFYISLGTRRLAVPTIKRMNAWATPSDAEPYPAVTSYEYSAVTIYGMRFLVGLELQSQTRYPENVLDYLLNGYKVIRSAS